MFAFDYNLMLWDMVSISPVLMYFFETPPWDNGTFLVSGTANKIAKMKKSA